MNFNLQFDAGQSGKVELIKQLFEQGKYPEFLTEKDIHSLASVLKVKHIINRSQSGHKNTKCGLG